MTDWQTGTVAHCRRTARPFTVRKQKRRSGSYNPEGIKMVHLAAEHVEMSVRADLMELYFEPVGTAV